MKYIFEEPFIEAKFIKKKSQYTAVVELYGEEYSCYFPGKEKIKERDIPCLLSVRKSLHRKTPYTIEALYIDNQWICINESLIEEALLSFLNQKEVEGNVEWNILQKPQFFSHLKDLIQVQKKTTFIEWKEIDDSWNETQKYWIEEAIDQGFTFISIELRINTDYIELVKWENRNESFL